MWRGGRGAAAAHPRGRLTLSSQPRAAGATVGRRVEAVGPTWGYLGFLGGLLLEDGVGAGGGLGRVVRPAAGELRCKMAAARWPRHHGCRRLAAYAQLRARWSAPWHGDHAQASSSPGF